MNPCAFAVRPNGEPFVGSVMYYLCPMRETEFSCSIVNSEYLKKIISGDVIDAAQKFHPIFTFFPFAKLIFATNRLPSVTDKSNGFYRRFILIPFNKTFTRAEQDRDLIFKLKAEIDGIFMFALRGLQRLGRQEDFSKSYKCNLMLNEFRSSNNVVEQFANECLEFSGEYYEIAESVYAEFSDYCNKNGFKPYNNVNFGKELIRLYKLQKIHKRINSQLKNCYIGVRLISSSNIAASF